MKISRFLLSFILLMQLACSTSVTSRKADKSETTEIQQFLDYYYKTVSKHRWDNVLNLMHPRVFDYMSRKDFEQELRKSFEIENFNLVFDDYKIESLSHVAIHGSDKYVLVRSLLKASMVLDSTIYEPGSIDGESCEEFKKELGSEVLDVQCFSEENRIAFIMIDESYVIYLNSQQKWVTLGNEKEGRNVVNKIIPAGVREKFGY